MTYEEQIRELHASGVSKTKAARSLGTSVYQLDLIIEAMNIAWKPRIRGGTHTINGIKDTLEGHAQRYGVSTGALRWRMAMGKPIEGPLAYRPISKEEAFSFVTLRKNGVPAMEAAKQVGRPYNNLKEAAKKYVPDYDQVVAQSKKKNGYSKRYVANDSNGLAA